jgi:Flp pilus assembly protein TadG
MRTQLPRGSAWRGLRSDRTAGAALEFAVVALPFITFLVFLLEIGYDFFAQVALDYGVQTAARQIQVGNAQGANTVALFKTDYLCPALSGLLPCSSVTVNVTPITSDYYSSVSATLPVNSSGTFSTSAFTYCPGSPNQLMLVQAYYLSPSLVAAVVPSMAASTAGGLERVTVSSMAFINENFPVTAPAPAGC